MSWITIINWGAWLGAAAIAAVILVDIIRVEGRKRNDSQK